MRWKYRKYFTPWYIKNRILYYFYRTCTIPGHIFCWLTGKDYQQWIWEYAGKGEEYDLLQEDKQRVKLLTNVPKTCIVLLNQDRIVIRVAKLGMPPAMTVDNIEDLSLVLIGIFEMTFERIGVDEFGLVKVVEL